MEIDDNSSDDEEFWMQCVAVIRESKTINIRKYPFQQLTDKQFKARFRLNKSTVLHLLSSLENRLEYTSDRNHSIEPMNQLLITLRFLSTGTFHLVVGDTIGVERSTCCRIIHKVIPLIAAMAKVIIKFPTSLEDQRQIMKAFFSISNIPEIIGALDCTHIPIFSPGGDNAEVFRNRRGHFSINTQLICTPDLIIQDAVARWPGSVHDSTIFDFSCVRAKFETDQPGSLVCDAGYPCRKYLLTPVANIHSEAENNYNAAHVKARNCIERCNGVLKRRFPALKYGFRININSVPETITAAIVLHNIARCVGDSDPPEDLELSAYMSAKMKQQGITVIDDQFDDVDVAENVNGGNTVHRTAIINAYFGNDNPI